MVDIPTGEDIHRRDWECLDCGTWYSADEDARRYDLPDFCPSCGDTLGWVNVKTGRRAHEDPDTWEVSE